MGTSNYRPDGTVAYYVLHNDGSREAGEMAPGPITDISDLARCKNLKSLRICCNQIRDISALAACEQLEDLVLESNPVESLHGIEHLNHIWEMSINWSNVTDLTPIANLENLRILCFNGTRVTEIPDGPMIKNICSLYAVNSFLKEIPYMGDVANALIDIRGIATGMKDLSFMRDIETFSGVFIDQVSMEELSKNL